MSLRISYDFWQPPPPPQNKGVIPLGLDEDDHAVTIDLPLLLSGRLLIQGPSGSGKSTLIRHLISQCPIQWLAIDPEGEYRNLPQLGGNATRLFSSGVLDISDYSREKQLLYLAACIDSLIAAPQELWTRRCLVIVDEVEIFTPTDVSAFEDPSVGKRSRSALIELMSRGRKRGLIACIATHRLAQLAASVRAEARNLLIGGSSFDVDIHRAADALGWTPKKAFAIIPQLPVGCFLASGPAFSKSPSLVRIPKP